MYIMFRLLVYMNIKVASVHEAEDPKLAVTKAQVKNGYIY